MTREETQPDNREIQLEPKLYRRVGRSFEDLVEQVMQNSDQDSHNAFAVEPKPALSYHADILETARHKPTRRLTVVCVPRDSPRLLGLPHSSSRDLRHRLAPQTDVVSSVGVKLGCFSRRCRRSELCYELQPLRHRSHVKTVRAGATTQPFIEREHG
jgi:hypothetical protein